MLESRPYLAGAILGIVACVAVSAGDADIVPSGFDPQRVELGLARERLSDGTHKVRTGREGESIYAEVLQGKVVGLRAISPKGRPPIPFLCAKDRLGKVFVVPIREDVRKESKMGRAVAERLAREKAFRDLVEQAVAAAGCWECIKFDTSDKDWGPISCELVPCPKGI